MIEHHRLLKRELARIRRLRTTLNESIRGSILFEDIHFAIRSGDKLKTPMFQARWYHHLWYCHWRPYINRVLGVFLGLCSLILLISETQVFLGGNSLIGYIMLV